METGLQLVTIGQVLNVLAVQFAIAKNNAMHRSKGIKMTLRPIHMGKTMSAGFLGVCSDHTFYAQPVAMTFQNVRGHI